MKSLTELRNQIAIGLCLFIIISTGCTAAYQTVNAELLEQNRGKIFKLGIVKAVGNQGDFRMLSSDIFGLRPSSIYFELVKTAVDTIPATEICSLLSSQYSIIIDADVDKAVRAGEEEKVEEYYTQRKDKSWGVERRKIKTLTAEYGNPSTKEFPNVINVTYSCAIMDIPRFFYDIDIISSGQKIVTLHGTIGGKFYYADLDSYIYYARSISEALKKDLSKASKVEPSKTVEITNVVPAISPGADNAN